MEGGRNQSVSQQAFTGPCDVPGTVLTLGITRPKSSWSHGLHQESHSLCLVSSDLAWILLRGFPRSLVNVAILQGGGYPPLLSVSAPAKKGSGIPLLICIQKKLCATALISKYVEQAKCYRWFKNSKLGTWLNLETSYLVAVAERVTGNSTTRWPARAQN